MAYIIWCLAGSEREIPAWRRPVGSSRGPGQSVMAEAGSGHRGDRGKRDGRGRPGHRGGRGKRDGRGRPGHRGGRGKRDAEVGRVIAGIAASVMPRSAGSSRGSRQASLVAPGPKAGWSTSHVEGGLNVMRCRQPNPTQRSRSTSTIRSTSMTRSRWPSPKSCDESQGTAQDSPWCPCRKLPGPTR